LPYGAVFNGVVLLAFVLAFIKAEGKGKLVLVAAMAVLFLLAAMAVLFLLPIAVPVRTAGWLWWTIHLAKALFGLGCLVYVRWQGLGYW